MDSWLRPLPRPWTLVVLAVIPVLLAATAASGQSFLPPALLSDSIPNSDVGWDYEPQVTTDGAGNWVAVWQSIQGLGGTTGVDWDILYSRSTDGGNTWSPPSTLNTNAISDSADDEEPRVSTDGAGNWVAVWRSDDSLGGTIGTDDDILFSRSTDGGVSWTAPSALNSNAATDGGIDWYPQITADGAGSWTAVWSSNDSLGGSIGTDADILFSRSTDGGATWTAPSALNTNAATDSGSDWYPQVTTDGTGNWVAVWNSDDTLGGTIGTDDDVLFSSSTNGGLTWSAPAPLNSDAASDSGDDFSPQLTTDSAGNWIAVWTSNESFGGTIGTDQDVLFSRSSNGGATWSSAATLNSNANTDSGEDYEPQLTTDGAGNWVAVWRSNDTLGGTLGTDWDLLFSRSTDAGGTWSPASALHGSAASDAQPDYDLQVATDGTGNWVTVWSSNNSLGETLGTDPDVLFSRSTNDGAAWSAPSALNSDAASDAGADAEPQVATDGAGIWVSVWTSVDSLDGTIGTDPDILFSRSTDGGSTWSAPSALNSNAATDWSQDHEPQVATDGAGNWLAVWRSYDSLGGPTGFDYDILFSRSADGGSSWSAPSALNTDAAADSSDDIEPQVTTDGSGNWVAVWRKDWKVLFSRSTDGGITWSVRQALDNAAPGPDFAPQVATDGAGNWIVVWESGDSLGGTIGTDPDVLFSRSTDGGATWSAPSALNTDAAFDHGLDWAPQLTTDGAGHWVAVWQASYGLGGLIGTDDDILFARSTDDGSTWSAPSVVNRNAPFDSSDDIAPQVTTDAAGNWVAVWRTSGGLDGMLGTDDDILFSRSTDNGATWNAPSALNLNAADDAGDDVEPQLTTDGAGKWVTVWRSNGGLGGVASFGVNDIFYAVASAWGCGDGLLDGAENCDDGNMLGGDCCSASCAFEAAGAPCSGDGVSCTEDVCDVAGRCGVSIDGQCDDSSACTVDTCDPLFDCRNEAEPVDPSQCRVALHTRLRIKDSPTPGRDNLRWDWKRGEAFDETAVGIPQVTTDYTLCVYDTVSGSPTLALELEVPPSSTLWTDDGSEGAQYRDKAGTADGVTQLQLKTGSDARSRIRLKAKGAELVLPAPAGGTFFEQDPSVIAQLLNSEGACWSSAFGVADNRKHDGSSFDAQRK